MTPTIKETGELLLRETMTIEQEACQVGHPGFKKWRNEVPGVEKALRVGNIGQGHDSGAGHPEEDKDSEVTERRQIKERVEGQNAPNDAHPQGKGQEDPSLRVAKESVVQGGHDRGRDKDTDTNVVQCRRAAHHRQLRVTEERMV